MDTMNVKATKRTGVVLAVIALVLVAASMAVGADAGLPGDTVGACCIGNGQVVWSTTFDDCQPDVGIFRPGVYSPTTDESPCDALPGGD